MGNCLRNPRTALDPILMSDESSPVAIGQNQPLSTASEVWTADIEVTEGQLRGKRDTFWETAPAYDGRKEIWDALKAACEAAGEGDHGLAQAILDGANVSLPRGRLVEAYDELGNRYVVPKYCISKPTNMIGSNNSTQGRPPESVSVEDMQEPDSTTKLLQGHTSSSSPSKNNRSGIKKTGGSKEGKRIKSIKGKQAAVAGMGSPPRCGTDVPVGAPLIVKVRLSTLSKDIKMTLQASDRVRDVKRRLIVEHELSTNNYVTLLYSGRVLTDEIFIKNLEIPKGYIIQAIVS